MSASVQADAGTPLLPPGARDAPSNFPRRMIRVLAVTSFAFLGGAFASQHMGLRTALARQGWVPCTGCPLLAPAPGGTQSEVTFTLHSACKTPETKSRYADFFRTDEKLAYLVRHNYGSPTFFETDDAIPMERVRLNDKEYGYRVTTDAVNFEWGFMLKNARTGEQVREIGPAGQSLLADTNCTQMYYPYFNRVMTLEQISQGSTQREFVFGTCGIDCPPDYIDTAFAQYLGESKIVVPTCGDVATGAAAPYDAGEADDARSLSMISAVLTRGGSTGREVKFGRMAAFKDTTYASTKTTARWLVAGTEGTDTTQMKVAYVDVTLNEESGRLSMCVSSKKSVPFDGRCRYIECAPTNYEMAVKAAEEGCEYSDALDLSSPLFMTPRDGDAVPYEYFQGFTNDAYLSTYTMHEAGTWGKDVDVRRVILTAAATCGGSSYSGNCVGTYTPFVDTRFTPTADEQRWLLISFVGEVDTVKMVSVRVYNEGGAIKISAMDRAWWRHRNGFNSGLRSGFEYDPYAEGFDPVAAYASPEGRADGVDRRFSDGGYGIGTLRWLLAVEMSPSLARMGAPPLAIQ